MENDRIQIYSYDNGSSEPIIDIVALAKHNANIVEKTYKIKSVKNGSIFNPHTSKTRKQNLISKLRSVQNVSDYAGVLDSLWYDKSYQSSWDHNSLNTRMFAAAFPYFGAFDESALIKIDKYSRRFYAHKLLTFINSYVEVNQNATRLVLCDNQSRFRYLRPPRTVAGGSFAPLEALRLDKKQRQRIYNIDQLRAGDLLSIKSKLKPYYHYGIFCWQESGKMVIAEYTNSIAGIAKYHKLAYIQLSVHSLCCNTHRESYPESMMFPPFMIMRRVLELLWMGGYAITSQNCEHFANYVVLGEKVSCQIDGGLRFGSP